MTGALPGAVPGERSGDLPGDQPGVVPGERPGDRLGAVPGDRPGNLPGDQLAGLTADRMGSGEPLLLLHGLGSFRGAWKPVQARLATTYETIAVDLPGHGDSPGLPASNDGRVDASPRMLARRIAEVVDALGLDRVHVAGHSLGGWVALELAVAGRARSVTALGPAGLWLVPRSRRSGPIRLNRWLATHTGRFQPAVLRHSWGRGAGFWTASVAPRALPAELVLDAAAAMAGSPGFEDAHDGTLGRRFDGGRLVPADVPVTVVFGDRDRILPARRDQERSLLPAHARWVVLDRCGHVPMWDRPGATVRLVRETANG